MNDDEFGLSIEESATLRCAAARYVNDGRVIVSPRKRLAQHRAKQNNTSSRAYSYGEDKTAKGQHAVSVWPAAAVALFVAGMLGITLRYSFNKSPGLAHTAAVIQVKQTPSAGKSVQNGAKPNAPRDDDAENDAAQKDDSAFHKSFTLAEGAALNVENPMGDIVIREIDGDKVVVSASKVPLVTMSFSNSVSIGDDRRELKFDIGGTASLTEKPLKETSTNGENKEAPNVSSIEIKHDPAKGDVHIRIIEAGGTFRASVSCSVGVPRNTKIGKIQTATGDISLSGGAGLAELETTSGAISVNNSRRVITAKSTSGDIEIKGASSIASVETSSGEISLDNVSGNFAATSASGEIKVVNSTGVQQLTTSSGNILVRNVQGRVSANSSMGEIDLNGVTDIGPVKTSSGDIRLENVGGFIDARSTFGNIVIIGASGIDTLENSSGDIDADVVRLAPGPANIHNNFGAIRLRVSDKLNASVQAVTSSGDVKSAVTGLKCIQPEWSFGAKIEGALGDGSRRFEIRTSSGDITINPLP